MGAAAAPLAPRRAAAICSRGARKAQRHILFRRARREARGGAASPRVRPLNKKKDGPRGFVPKGEKEAKNTRAPKKRHLFIASGGGGCVGKEGAGGGQREKVKGRSRKWAAAK